MSQENDWITTQDNSRWVFTVEDALEYLGKSLEFFRVDHNDDIRCEVCGKVIEGIEKVPTIKYPTHRTTVVYHFCSIGCQKIQLALLEDKLALARTLTDSYSYAMETLYTARRQNEPTDA